MSCPPGELGDALEALRPVALGLATLYPGAACTLSAPDDAGGTWWLDVTAGEASFSVQWSPARGLGLSVYSTGCREAMVERFERAPVLLGRLAGMVGVEAALPSPTRVLRPRTR